MSEVEYLRSLITLVPPSIKFGIAEVLGAVPDDFVRFIEQVGVGLVSLVAKAVF